MRCAMIIQYKNNPKVIVCALLFLFFLTNPLQLLPLKTANYKAVALFDELKANIDQLDKCFIELLEEGEGYSLSFEGTFFNDSRIKGQIKNFEQPIDIYRFRDNYFVKNKSNHWIEAKKLELDGLSFFLRTPWEMLNLFNELPEKQIINMEDSISVSSSNLKSNKNLIEKLFPHLNAQNIVQVQLTLFFKKEEKLPIRILIEGLCPERKKIIVKRTYIF